MPLKAEEPATGWRETQRWEEGFGWIAHPDEDMQRASTALAVDGAVWVIDPVDARGLDDALAEFGDVAGVVLLLDRHKRDAARVANRHGVPVYLPEWFEGVETKLDAPVERFGAELDDTGYGTIALVDNRFWQEVALFDGSTLVVPEAVGTVPYVAPGRGRLGVNPALRLWPPRGALGGLDPDRILVGHGEGIPAGEGAATELTRALANARRGAPRALAGALAETVAGIVGR